MDRGGRNAGPLAGFALPVTTGGGSGEAGVARQSCAAAQGVRAGQRHSQQGCSTWTAVQVTRRASRSSKDTIPCGSSGLGAAAALGGAGRVISTGWGAGLWFANAEPSPAMQALPAGARLEAPGYSWGLSPSIGAPQRPCKRLQHAAERQPPVSRHPGAGDGEEDHRRQVTGRLLHPIGRRARWAVQRTAQRPRPNPPAAPRALFGQQGCCCDRCSLAADSSASRRRSPPPAAAACCLFILLFAAPAPALQGLAKAVGFQRVQQDAEPQPQEADPAGCAHVAATKQGACNIKHRAGLPQPAWPGRHPCPHTAIHPACSLACQAATAAASPPTCPLCCPLLPAEHSVMDALRQAEAGEAAAAAQRKPQQ